MRVFGLPFLCLILLFAWVPSWAQQSGLEIELKNNTRAERLAKEELERLLKTHDLSPWFFTSKLVIDQEDTPHSHPILTLHTRHIGDPLRLLTTFLHEQIHRSLTDWPERREARDKALEELQVLFPTVPQGRPYGARDTQSTYLHLVVCYLELEALTGYIGRPAARRVLDSQTHYKWIYATVLSNAGEKVAEVVRQHGLHEYPSLSQ